MSAVGSSGDLAFETEDQNNDIMNILFLPPIEE